MGGWSLKKPGDFTVAEGHEHPLVDLKAFALHCNVQTSGLGSFITNNWEF
jgi:hypothetical protein